MITPCEGATYTGQVINGLLNVLTLFLGMWLAHRRKSADAERRWFYRQMRYRHGLEDADLRGPSASKDKVK